MDDRVLLVDAHNMIMRYIAVSVKNKREGSVLYGLLGFLKRFLKRDDYNIEQVVFVFDSTIPEFRFQLYPDYKGKREDIYAKDFFKIGIQQIDVVKTYLPKLGVIVADLPKFEADDCIFKIIKEYDDKKFIVYSADKDFHQIDSTNIHVIRPVNHKNIREERVDRQNHFLIRRALMGDQSDNIKGVPQIGKKRSEKIINEIGESKLQKFLDNIGKCKLYAKKLEENKDVIARNYNLMSLDYAYMFHSRHIRGRWVKPQKFEEKTFINICRQFNLKKYITSVYALKKVFENLNLTFVNSFDEVDDIL